MIKLIALFKKPDDVDAFEQHYNAIHVPLIKQVPHMSRFVSSRVWGAPRGEPAYYRIAEMYFDDRAAFDQAMASDENRAAGKDLMSFARDVVTMIFVESEDGATSAGGAA
ncbi:MAG TPA: EthD family reductase [Chloroflexia bacterium]|nr:EthD family reductase [Chloroflexia bacterium]